MDRRIGKQIDTQVNTLNRLNHARLRLCKVETCKTLQSASPKRDPETPAILQALQIPEFPKTPKLWSVLVLTAHCRSPVIAYGRVRGYITPEIAGKWGGICATVACAH